VMVLRTPLLAWGMLSQSVEGCRVPGGAHVKVPRSLLALEMYVVLRVSLWKYDLVVRLH
jgi:hypothetical protein